MSKISDLILEMSTSMSADQIKKWNLYRSRLWGLCDQLNDISYFPSIDNNYGKELRNVVEVVNELPIILKKGEVFY